MKQTCDVVIVGTGVAGLYCALNLPDYMKIRMITKRKADESDSWLAQGGICMLRGEDDYEPYFEDTMRAGHYENNEKTVDLMIRSSNSIIRNLVQRGVRFSRDPDGELEFTREGAHSRPRILFHEDVTGKEITSVLLKQAMEKPNITIDEYTTMADIVCRDHICRGVVAFQEIGKPYVIEAPHVVLACGGVGGLFDNSTNFPHITGDALAIALEHGVEVEHLDYIQIHPTTLYSEKPGRRFLISESVRGEGALLYDKNGERFTDELKPRDLLSADIRAQMETDGTRYVWEDLRPLGEQVIREHFPNIYSHCLEEGLDVLSEPIPVVPAQHYFMGGIRADLSGRTSMQGLYACGETGCNGVHGRNRLASNSLLESLVFAQRAADDIAFGKPSGERLAVSVDLEKYRDADALFAHYRRLVRDEMDRMKRDHSIDGRDGTRSVPESVAAEGMKRTYVTNDRKPFKWVKRNVVTNETVWRMRCGDE
ncbi:MAG: L-aspartate oxidase [Clostridiales bacterium]|nr:L-aspartate oxidase [Clostridiales bacterium]